MVSPTTGRSPSHPDAGGLDDGQPARRRFQQGMRGVLAARPQAGAVQLSGVWTSWDRLAELRDALGALLAEVPPGPVALVLRNRPSGIAALFALLDAGRTTFLVSPIQPPVAISADVRRCGVVAVVADGDDWSPELSAVPTCSGVELGAAPDGAVTARPRAGAERVAHAPAVGVDLPTDAAVVVPTSGTTGPPKRIPLTWDSLPVPQPRAAAAAVVINGLSSVTITGLMTVLRSMAAGRPVALLERLEVRAWAALVREHRPRVAGLPPAAMRSLLDSDVDPADLASIEMWPTGSAPVPAALQEEFEERFRIPVLVAYGATEFGGAVARWTLEEHRSYATAKRGSVGRAATGVRLRIVDQATGAELGSDAEGLLEVDSVRAPVAAGEWIRTNDLAHLDADGFLYIHGRADDVIVRGGFKVPLGELEELLCAHPSVRAAGAVGIPDARLGAVPVAAVTVLPGAPAVSEQELKDWVRARSAPYKVPVQVRVVEELPQTVSHKVSRAGLVELFGGAGTVPPRGPAAARSVTTPLDEPT